MAAIFVSGTSQLEAPAVPGRRVRWLPLRSARPGERPAGTVSALFPTVPLATDVAQLRDYALDVLLALNPHPEITRAAPAVPHGLWVFDFDWHETVQGVPAGFWEVHDGTPTTSAALLEMETAGETWTARKSGVWQTVADSFAGNRERLLATVADWPALACRALRHLDRPVRRPPVQVPATADRTTPRRTDLIRLWVRAGAHRVRVAWRRLFRHAQWNVGVVEAPVTAFLEPGPRPTVRWFRSDRQRFYADPFGIWRDGRLTVLCEEYPYGAARGRLTHTRYGDGAFAPAMVSALDEPFHLSYPCLIEHAGVVYCVPETCRERRITLYRAVRFPDEWVRDTIMVDDFPGVDPTVLLHDGKWWLMCTDADHGADSHLFLWHADELSGPWRPHVLNPVKIDVRSARPGGAPFVCEGRLYRPAQDCSRSYGGRITINHVTRLTPTAFDEQPARVVEPFHDEPFQDGLHTLSAAGTMTLVDGLTYVFSPAAMRRYLGIVFRDAVSRLRR